MHRLSLSQTGHTRRWVAIAVVICGRMHTNSTTIVSKSREERVAHLKGRVREMTRLGWAPWNWQYKRIMQELTALEKGDGQQVDRKTGEGGDRVQS